MPDPQRLLIVDDDPLVANAMKRVLSSEYEVEACTDATEALRRLDNDVNDFDLVVCDLMMPSTTGVQLHEQLLGIRPAIAERMLFVTGGAVTQSAMNVAQLEHELRTYRPATMPSLPPNFVWPRYEGASVGNLAATVAQVRALAKAGSELVRVTVNSAEAAAAVPAIRERLASG